MALKISYQRQLSSHQTIYETSKNNPELINIEAESISCIFWPSFGGQKDQQKERKTFNVSSSFEFKRIAPEVSLSFDDPKKDKY